ncbi:uncharacterized protein [Battus philenor]|uniref:uncharacterized protein n=1 Tax=Battus philenor TaxID=42288 RepID=UPI0035D0C676
MRRLRALRALLALLTLAAATDPARVLLVPRVACAAHDATYFSASSLRSYAAAANRSLDAHDLHVLSYNGESRLDIHTGAAARERGTPRLRNLLPGVSKTLRTASSYEKPQFEESCGAGWRAAVVRGAWGARGGVALTGRAGADAALCGALRAVRAVSWAHHARSPEGACGTSLWRAAAAAALAARLGWRRVLLAGCTAPALAGELASAGFLVRRQPLSQAELDRQPHVVMLCAADERAARLLREARAPAPAVLLLHTAAARDGRDEHDGRSPPYLKTNNFLDILEILTSGTKHLSRPGNVSEDLHVSRSNSVAADEMDASRKDIFISILKNIHKKEKNPEAEHEENRSAAHLPAFRFLILSDDDLEAGPRTRTSVALYEQIIDALQRHLRALATGREEARATFFLYEGAPRPLPVAQLVVTSARSLDGAGDWTSVVSIVDLGSRLRRWSTVATERLAAAAWTGVAWAVSALAACGALALLVLLAAGVCVARRARARSSRVVPVLPAAHFSFPVDEHRVGGGMESMVCWLQQLHDCGAQEARGERPASAPLSAPSSTCSVTRLAPDRRIRYKGEPVRAVRLPGGALQLRRRAADVLLALHALRHENLSPFVGCLAEVRPALVFEAGGRGSLEEVLMADDIRLDWTFRLSLLTDLARGMRYLHASPLRTHGRLSSRSCAVDARWVLRVSDYGVPAFARAQALDLPPRSARELLWTAPELLREQAPVEGRGEGELRGSPPGDVFSFGIIMQEVIVRGEPYCMLPLTPEEIVEKLRRPPPLVRPSVSMGAAPPDAVGLMRQCWSEAPDLRPDFPRIYDLFRHMHRGRKINIVDSMFEMLEKYSNNLEELIKERTEQLDLEKKKTEQLLNRMLPRSVAERLMAGSRVEPEEFEEVSIYFSDIVGFTELAARSTPVQVVDLLNDLYTTFDAAIEQYRVYKVETIGDAYMVVGGLPTRTPDHAESVATMALHLLHLAGRFRVRHLPATPLHLRIGLHSGPCCAAVVGLTMPRYCLFGDTVNTASRMESTGAAWRIQVSAATAERLMAAGGFRLRSRGLRQIKGKGAMHTYWLLGKDGFERPLPAPPPLDSEEVLYESEGESESSASGAGAASRLPRDAPRTPRPARASRPRALSDAESEGAAATRTRWARSGAASADSSPPRAPRPARARVPLPRYRCLGGGARVLRRQWSLERGDELAVVGAHAEPFAELLAEPLALRLPPPRPPPVRYRTRPSSTSPSSPPSPT